MTRLWIRHAVHSLVWMGVSLLVAVLALARYRGAVAAVGSDFEIYRSAAGLLWHGHSVYSEPRYVYSPLLAVLLAPLSGVETETVWSVWSAIAIASLIVAAVLIARANGLRRGPVLPLFIAVAAVSSLHFWPTTIELLVGQVQWLTLLLLSASTLGSSRGRFILAGVLTGLTGVLKTWPAPVVAAHPHRKAALVAGVVTLLVAPGLALLGGPDVLVQFMRRTLDSSSQPLVSHSIWGTADLLFTRTGRAQPLMASAPLHVAAITVGVVLVLALLFMICTTSESVPGLKLWNLLAVVILVLPVSHITYSLLWLPILWTWLLRAVSGHRDRPTLIAGVGLVLWWIVVSRAWPDNGSDPTITAVRYAVVGLSNLAAAVVSVTAAFAISRRPANRLPRVRRSTDRNMKLGQTA